MPSLPNIMKLVDWFPYIVVMFMYGWITVARLADKNYVMAGIFFCYGVSLVFFLWGLWKDAQL